MKNRKTEKPTGKAWVAVVGHSPPTNVAQVQILAISAMSVTFNLLLTIINKKLSFSGHYKIQKPLTWDEGLLLTLVNLMGKALKRAACKVCALWPINFVLLRVQWRFFFFGLFFCMLKGLLSRLGRYTGKLRVFCCLLTFLVLRLGIFREWL